METVESRMRSVEVDFICGHVPTAEAMLAAAAKEQSMPLHVSASDYFATIKTLREEKFYTWLECAEWFKEKGLPFSMASLTAAYRRGANA